MRQGGPRPSLRVAPWSPLRTPCHTCVFIVTEVPPKSPEEQEKDSCFILFKLQFQKKVDVFQDQFSIKGVSSALCQTEKA